MQANNEQQGIDQAVRTTLGFLEKDPRNVHLLARIADLYLDTGDAAAAAPYVETLLEVAPGDPHALYRKGHVLLAQRDWAAAADIFEPLVQRHEALPIAHALARCRAEQGAYPEVVRALEKHAESPELPADAATLLVRALHHTLDLNRAEALINVQRERLEHAPGFLAAASLAMLDHGKIELATALSDAAMQAGEAPIEALVVRGTLAVTADSQGPAQAAEMFRAVLARNPREGRSWSGLGMTSVMARDFKSGIAELEKALEFMPHHIGTMHMLAWCHIFTGNLDAAAAVLDRAMEEDRNFGETHGAFAVVAAMRGQQDAATAHIDRALRLDRECLSARYAQMILTGEAADQGRVRAIALKLLSRRPAPQGGTLADVMRRHQG